MFEPGCFGRIQLGPLPEEVRRRLARVEAEWLEFDPSTGDLLLRPVEPVPIPPLPTIARELVGYLVEIPPEHHAAIRGGDFFVHLEEGGGQLVRFRVEKGGALRIQWAHPHFRRALRRPWAEGVPIPVDPEVQRLNGEVAFECPSAGEAAASLEALVEGFEGLYPEGDFVVRALDAKRVEVTLKDVNLDAARFVKRLLELSEPRTLTGRFEVSAFGPNPPEHRLRFLFEDGRVWIQHPLLWAEVQEGQGPDR